MGRYKETPRYNIISMSVSDSERQELQTIASQQALSISEMMRQAMDWLTAKNETVAFWSVQLRGE
jgi:hypothetical protein